MGGKVFRDRRRSDGSRFSKWYQCKQVLRERSSRTESKYSAMCSTVILTHTRKIVTLQYYMYLACAGYRESTRNIAITSSFVLQPNRRTLGGYMRLVARRSTSLNLRVSDVNAKTLYVRLVRQREFYRIASNSM